jgi:hypothetical protein
VKALVVANDFLEAQVEDLRADVSKGTRAATTADDSRRTPDDGLFVGVSHDRSDLLRGASVRRPVVMALRLLANRPNASIRSPL